MESSPGLQLAGQTEITLESQSVLFQTQYFNIILVQLFEKQVLIRLWFDCLEWQWLGLPIWPSPFQPGFAFRKSVHYPNKGFHQLLIIHTFTVLVGELEGLNQTQSLINRSSNGQVVYGGLTQLALVVDNKQAPERKGKSFQCLSKPEVELKIYSGRPMNQPEGNPRVFIVHSVSLGNFGVLVGKERNVHFSQAAFPARRVDPVGIKMRRMNGNHTTDGRWEKMTARRTRQDDRIGCRSNRRSLRSRSSWTPQLYRWKRWFRLDIRRCWKCTRCQIMNNGLKKVQIVWVRKACSSHQGRIFWRIRYSIHQKVAALYLGLGPFKEIQAIDPQSQVRIVIYSSRHFLSKSTESLTTLYFVVQCTALSLLTITPNIFYLDTTPQLCVTPSEGFSFELTEPVFWTAAKSHSVHVEPATLPGPCIISICYAFWISCK